MIWLEDLEEFLTLTMPGVFLWVSEDRKQIFMESDSNIYVYEGDGLMERMNELKNNIEQRATE